MTKLCYNYANVIATITATYAVKNLRAHVCDVDKKKEKERESDSDSGWNADGDYSDDHIIIGL